MHNLRMPVSVDTLRLQLDYSAWASQRLMDAAAKLSPDELTRDFKTSDKTVLDTLVHIYAADRIWLPRVLDEPPTPLLDPPVPPSSTPRIATSPCSKPSGPPSSSAGNSGCAVPPITTSSAPFPTPT